MEKYNISIPKIVSNCPEIFELKRFGNNYSYKEWELLCSNKIFLENLMIQNISKSKNLADKILNKSDNNINPS